MEAGKLSVDENSTLKKKKGNFIQGKLRILSPEADSQKALGLVHLSEAEGTAAHISETRVVHQNNTLTFYTEVPAHTVQVSSAGRAASSQAPSAGREHYFLKKLRCSHHRKEKKCCLWWSRPSQP